jgi:hypothetical protein
MDKRNKPARVMRCFGTAPNGSRCLESALPGDNHCAKHRAWLNAILAQPADSRFAELERALSRALKGN